MLPPQSLRPLRIAMLVLMAGLGAAGAQENAGLEKALEKLFALGLPEAKGGKWVRFSNENSEPGGTMPGDYNTRYSGNAWLVREEKGVAQLVTSDGRVVRGKRARDDDENEGSDGALRVMIQPGNLDHDLGNADLIALRSGK